VTPSSFSNSLQTFLTTFIIKESFFSELELIKISFFKAFEKTPAHFFCFSYNQEKIRFIDLPINEEKNEQKNKVKDDLMMVEDRFLDKVEEEIKRGE
jgi:hypothetical protein